MKLKMRLIAVITALFFFVPFFASASAASGSFTVTAFRGCADNSVNVQFSGDAIPAYGELSLHNTSDGWTTGFSPFSPVAGVYSPVARNWDVVAVRIPGLDGIISLFVPGCAPGDVTGPAVSETVQVGDPEPVDTDGDKVNDDVDACPTVPGPVETDGCPAGKEVDTDGDKVNDDVDACPTVPGPVENDGCPVDEPTDPTPTPAPVTPTPTPVPGGGDGDGDGDSDGDGGTVDNGGDTDTDVDPTPVPVTPVPVTPAPAVNPVTGLPVTGNVGPGEDGSTWPLFAAGTLVLLAGGVFVGTRRRVA